MTLTLLKFCGLTRAEDAAFAASLGAEYAGVIFAGGPRNLSEAQARSVLQALPSSVRRVGVFATNEARSIKRVVETVGLDVVQLHSDPGAADVDAVRAVHKGEVWAVCRPGGADPSERLEALFSTADAVLLDAFAPDVLGGSGRTLPWHLLAESVGKARRGRKLILADGLDHENVASAIDALRPDVVDVSSGVEDRPGIKNRDLMRRFATAVTGAGRGTKAVL